MVVVEAVMPPVFPLSKVVSTTLSVMCRAGVAAAAASAASSAWRSSTASTAESGRCANGI